MYNVINRMNLQSGQALITLIFYVIIILTVTSASVIIIAINSISATKLQQGNLAYYVAEGAAENALLRVLRDPAYVGETNLLIGSGSADITVNRSNPVTIVATGKLGNFIRKIQITLLYASGAYTINSWTEIP
jgi:2',3'-cyclic-nucleotide 2'-phosphodiesterase (5'-nucleotidase family)